MGYYTVHNLEIEGLKDTDIDFYDHAGMIEKLSGYTSLFDGESLKWYDHEQDMKAYSKKFPKLLFILSGEGEESGDIWKDYYKSGRHQLCKAKITFDKYDESKFV